MVDVLYAHNVITLGDNQTATQHTFKDTVGTNLVVTAVKSIEVIERQTQSASNHPSVTYDVIMGYTVGGTSLVSVQIDEVVTTGSTTVTNIGIFNNTYDTYIRVIPKLRKASNDVSTYHVFLITLGNTSGGDTVNVNAQRLQLDTNNLSGIAGVTGETSFEASGASQVAFSGGLGFYDVFSLSVT